MSPLEEMLNHENIGQVGMLGQQKSKCYLAKLCSRDVLFISNCGKIIEGNKIFDKLSFTNSHFEKASFRSSIIRAILYKLSFISIYSLLGLEDRDGVQYSYQYQSLFIKKKDFELKCGKTFIDRILLKFIIGKLNKDIDTFEKLNSAIRFIQLERAISTSYEHSYYMSNKECVYVVAENLPKAIGYLLNSDYANCHLLKSDSIGDLTPNLLIKVPIMPISQNPTLTYPENFVDKYVLLIDESNEFKIISPIEYFLSQHKRSENLTDEVVKILNKIRVGNGIISPAEFDRLTVAIQNEELLPCDIYPIDFNFLKIFDRDLFLNTLNLFTTAISKHIDKVKSVDLTNTWKNFNEAIEWYNNWVSIITNSPRSRDERCKVSKVFDVSNKFTLLDESHLSQNLVKVRSKLFPNGYIDPEYLTPMLNSSGNFKQVVLIEICSTVLCLKGNMTSSNYWVAASVDQTFRP